MSIAKKDELLKLQQRLEALENRLGGMPYNMRSFVKGEMKNNTNVIEQAEVQFGLYTALCVYTIDEWKQNRANTIDEILY